MDALTLSRLQFGTTIVYHFFFVPLTLGLSILVAIMETLYVRSGNIVYKRMAQFWGKLFLINFAMGVVTGIVQEFQFGMNWSSYSRFVGDVFGAPLALEGLIAFFAESTFLGLWIFGWQQLSKRVHLAMIWLVAIASHISAFWILVANSFMQQPEGYVLRNGRAEMVDFLALIFNPHLWYQFPHVVAGGLVTGAFFVVGISAYHFIKRSKDHEFYQRSLRIGLTAALIGSIGAALIGHLQGQYVSDIQPMKTAASEGLWHTEKPAAFTIFAITDEKNGHDIFAIRVPYLLSFLDHNNFTGEVQGIHELQAQYEKQYGPGNYIPPVAVTFWSFRTMVGVAIMMALLSMAGLFLLWRSKLSQYRWFLWLLVGSIAFPYIANSTGWILTEMGRQPWIVNGLLRTADAVSPSVSAGMVLTSLSIFAALYSVLAVIDVYLLRKYAIQGSELEHAEQEQEQKVKEEQLVLSY